MNRHGFTLIELMVAIGLGTLVVYVAAAGLRVLSQSITQANRIALENTIMRSGMQLSLDYVDFWTDRDDPTSNIASDQALRVMAPDRTSPHPVNRGLAFTPLSLSVATTGYGAAPARSTSESVVNAGRLESPRGWDPNAWHPAAARTWCLTSMVEGPVLAWARLYSPLQQMQGRYHLLAAPEAINVPAPNHPWQARQATGLLLSLGVYGMMDYLPANVPRIVYARDGSAPSTESPWTISSEWAGGGGGPVWEYGFGGTWQNSRCGGGLYGLTQTSGMAVPHREIPSAQLSHVNNRGYYLAVSGLGSYHLNNLAAVNGFAEMRKDCEYIDNVLRDELPGLARNKPAHWPFLDVQSLRFLREGTFINLQRIVMTDSFTGKSTQISFTCFGTTLRGARQQRRKGIAGTASGWVDPFAASPADTLDSP
jgi:prepilin-type N-terminal cleavage/methylation domain-containing protein